MAVDVREVDMMMLPRIYSLDDLLLFLGVCATLFIVACARWMYWKGRYQELLRCDPDSWASGWRTEALWWRCRVSKIEMTASEPPKIEP